MAVEVRHQWLEFLEKVLAPLHREGTHHAHARQDAVAVVQPEQQGPDPVRAAGVHAVARQDAVRSAFVLDLEHDALVRLVAAVQGLGHNPVEAGSFELVEPLLRRAVVPRCGGQVDRRGTVREGLLQHAPPLGKRPAGEVLVVQRQQVERHKLRRRLRRQELHPAGRGVDPLLERFKVQPVTGLTYQDDLAVEHAARRQVRLQCLHQFGEVAGHGLAVAAADLHLVAVPENDGPEAVPLRFEAPFRAGVRDFGQGADGFGQHGRDRGHHRQLHNAHSYPPVRAAPPLGGPVCRGPGYRALTAPSTLVSESLASPNSRVVCGS